MISKTLPFDRNFIEKLTKQYPTPFYLYDERTLRKNARWFNEAFAWNPGFKEYFAVKANPNFQLLKILQSENIGGDCSSLPELLLCERAGITGENIMFTSNNTPENEFEEGVRLGAIINLDDITHLPFLEKTLQKSNQRIPDILSFRWNPGPLRDVESVIGNPVDSKYGMTNEQILEVISTAKNHGVKRFGIHTMIASNMLQQDFFKYTAKMMFEFAIDIEHKLGVHIEFVNIGGGFGIAYKPDQIPLDLTKIGNDIREEYEQQIPASLGSIKLFTESGRFVAAESGTLITRVIHEKQIYKHYIGVDACMANLMRPGMYGAYHHITVL
ncbi:MAG: diaminopimelate decarboxylase, partial [Thermoguttaceae bacterium]